MEAIRAMQMPDSCRFFNAEPGKEPFKMLAYLGTLYNGIEIVDIGTDYGYTAQALSVGNTNNTIISFDLKRKGSPPMIDNITYYFENLMEPATREVWKDRILRSSIITLDSEPHDGISEYNFYLWLRDNNYQGIMVCDDILFSDNMRNDFWEKVAPEHKIDITKFGHWSGTGLIFFNPDSVPLTFRD